MDSCLQIGDASAEICQRSHWGEQLDGGKGQKDF